MALAKKQEYYDRIYSGYTILELSIVLTIVAVLIAGGLSSLNNYIQYNRTQTTNERLDAIDRALQRFVEKNGYLPCPSALNLIEADVNFGIATTYDATLHTCDTGIITANTGSVPVYTLGLSNDHTYDGWNRKFTYRIASGLGSRSSFNARTPKEDLFSGELKVTDIYGIEKTSTFYDPPQGAAYILLSHGANGIGGWHKNSTETPGSEINSPEFENLNHELNKRYIQSYIPTPAFDDILIFRNKSSLLSRFTSSPLLISTETCSNAFSIVGDGDPAIYDNDLADYASTFNAEDLVNQVYSSAKVLADMCDNPPTIPAPYQISGLSLWLDANDHDTILPSPDGSVTSWVDKSRNNYSFIQNTGSNRPTHNIDTSASHSFITFDGNDYLEFEKLYGKSIFASSQATFFFVIKDNVSSAGDTWLHWQNGTHNIQLLLDGSQRPMIDYAELATSPTASSNSTIDTISLVTAVKSPTSGGNTLDIVVRGSALTSVANSSVVDINAAQTLTIGTDVGLSNFWVGNLYEVIIFNRALTENEQTRIQQYLVDKWLL